MTEAALDHRGRLRHLTSVTVPATHPPRRGQQVRTAGVLGNLGPGWLVDSWSLMIQRTDLPMPRRHHAVTPTWTDHRTFDPLSLAWVGALTRLGCPPVHVSTAASLLPHRRLRRELRAASLVMVDSPYAVAWVRAATPRPTPVVMNAHNIETGLYPAESGWRHRVASEIERCEAAALRAAALVFVPSDDDARRATDIGAHRVVVVPNGVDLDRFWRADADRRPALRVELGLPADRRLAVFTGAGHPPNAEAVRILEQHAEAYAAADVTVMIVGRCGVGRAPVRNVIHVGEVPEVAPYLAVADVGVCPLRSGGGTSFKTIEYLAASLPVVTTPVGARGLRLVAGRDAVVCEADEMPGQVRGLLANPLGAASLADAGRTAAEAFSWAGIGAVAAVALDEVMEGRPAGPARVA